MHQPARESEAAAALIYLMATDPDVENLLINGIEGQHYQVLEDNTATYVDGKDISTTRLVPWLFLDGIKLYDFHSV